MLLMQELNKLRSEILASETFCFYPFLEISTNPVGHMKPCCNYIGTIDHDDGNPISILKGDTFDSVWNSNPMKSIRKDLHQGNIPAKCRRCIRDGDASMRYRSIKEYNDNIEILQLVKNTIDNDYHADHQPIILELKPSNLCNLKCVMCNSYDSSQIAKELKELSNKFGGINVRDGRFMSISDQPGIRESNQVFKDVDQPEWDDNEVIWENFKRIAPYLQILSFAGGEPTIMPSVLRILNFCVENDYAKNITVFISSNFTNLNKNFFDIMPHYKKFELISSIDGVGTVNDYCRFPSKWSQISKNYLLAKQYMKHSNVKMMTNITVNLLNVVNVTDLLYWLEERAEELPCYKEWPFNVNLIMYPPEQQIKLLPDDLKQLTISRLEEYMRVSKILKSFPGLDSKIHLIIRELQQPGDPKLLEIFKSRIKILDEHRKIDIRNYIPEIGKMFDE
jgi:MoaA/NifB/PqqE/SkfB family radical SAM enzyme